MIEKLRVFSIYLLLLMVIWPMGQVTGQVLENYDIEITYEEKEAFFNTYKSANVLVDLKNFPQAQIRIKLPNGAGLFFNGILGEVAKQDTVLYFGSDDLRNKIGGQTEELLVGVFKKGLEQGAFSLQKGYFKEEVPSLKQLEREDLIRKRDANVMQDFFFTAVLSILILFSLFRTLFPSVFSIFWGLDRILSFEDLWESVGISKIYSAELLFYLFTINSGISLFIVIGMYETGLEVFGEKLGQSLNFLLLLWLSSSAILTALFFLKFLWLGANTFVFDLKRIALPHFFYLLKVTGLGLLVVLTVLVIINSNGIIFPEGYFTYVSYVFFGFYAFGIISLLFWLSNKVGLKNYHLFSYLCTSELIPFLVIFKLILG